VWGAPFGQWGAGHSVAPYGRGVGEAGPFWPCSGAVPKGVAVGGQWAKARLPFWPESGSRTRWGAAPALAIGPASPVGPGERPRWGVASGQ